MELCFERLYGEDYVSNNIDGIKSDIYIDDGINRLIELSPDSEVLEFVDDRVDSKNAGYYKIKRNVAYPENFAWLEGYNYILFGNILLRGNNLRIATLFVGDSTHTDSIEWTRSAFGTVGGKPGTINELRGDFLHVINWLSAEGKNVIENRLLLHYSGSQGNVLQEAQVLYSFKKVLDKVKDQFESLRLQMRSTKRQGRLTVYLNDWSSFSILNPGLNTDKLPGLHSPLDTCFYELEPFDRADFISAWTSTNESVKIANSLKRGVRYGNKESSTVLGNIGLSEEEKSRIVIKSTVDDLNVSYRDYVQWLYEGMPSTIKTGDTRVNSSAIRFAF